MADDADDCDCIIVSESDCSSNESESSDDCDSIAAAFLKTHDTTSPPPPPATSEETPDETLINSSLLLNVSFSSVDLQTINILCNDDDLLHDHVVVDSDDGQDEVDNKQCDNTVKNAEELFQCFQCHQHIVDESQLCFCSLRHPCCISCLEVQIKDMLMSSSSPSCKVMYSPIPQIICLIYVTTILCCCY